MGGDSSILTELLQPEVGPEVFLPLAEMPQTSRDVVILDMHQRRFGISWNGSKELTTRQAVEYFIRMIKRYEHINENPEDHVRAILLLFDKSRFVPKEKARVQGVRRSNSKLEPYPPGCSLTPAGVMLPDGTVQILDAERLPITGYLFREFAAYLEQELIAHHRLSPFPSQIVMDYHRLDDVKGVLVLADTGVEHRDSFYNEIGEVDMLVNFYLPYFTGKEGLGLYSVRLYSSDLDHLPILLSWFDTRTDWPANLYWIRQEKVPTPPAGKRKEVDGEPLPTKPLYAIEMTRLYGAVRSGIASMIGMSVHPEDNVKAFVLFCILNGTDYCQRKLLSHQFGWHDVLKAVCKAWPELSLHLDRLTKTANTNAMPQVLAETTGLEIRQPLAVFVHNIANHPLWSLVYYLFDQKPTLFKSGKPILKVSASGTTESSQSLDWYKMELTKQKKFKIPTTEDMIEASAQVHFNWLYWTQ